MQGRLAPRELHGRRRHRLLVAQRPQQPHHLLEGRLRQVARLVRAREAHRAGQVAAVAEVDLAEARRAHVLCAQAAVGGTGDGLAGLVLLDAALVLERAPLAQEPQLRVRGDLVPEVAVLRAGLLHPHRPVPLVAAAEDEARALRAQRLHRARQGTRDGPDGPPGEGPPRLAGVRLHLRGREEDVHVRLAPGPAARAVVLERRSRRHPPRGAGAPGRSPRSGRTATRPPTASRRGPSGPASSGGATPCTARGPSRQPRRVRHRSSPLKWFRRRFRC